MGSSEEANTIYAEEGCCSASSQDTQNRAVGSSQPSPPNHCFFARRSGYQGMVRVGAVPAHINHVATTGTHVHILGPPSPSRPRGWRSCTKGEVSSALDNGEPALSRTLALCWHSTSPVERARPPCPLERAGWGAKVAWWRKRQGTLDPCLLSPVK